MIRRTYRYKSLSVNFPARAGGLVVVDIKGEAAGGTLGTAREKSDCKCWWKASSTGSLRVSRNAATAGCAHIAGQFPNICGGTFALSCKQHPHALLGPDAAGDLIISPRCLRRLAAPNAGGSLQTWSFAWTLCWGALANSGWRASDSITIHNSSIFFFNLRVFIKE